MYVLMVTRAVQTTRRSDPPGQTDRTRTVLRPIRLLRRSAAGPYFPKPIPADRVRVSSSNTRATRPDRHINGFKGLKFVTLSSHSQFLLSLSPLSPTISAILRRSCSSSILPLCRQSLPFHRQSVHFVVDLRSSSATS